MKAVRSFEISRPNYPVTVFDEPQDGNPRLHRCGNIKTRKRWCRYVRPKLIPWDNSCCYTINNQRRSCPNPPTDEPTHHSEQCQATQELTNDTFRTAQSWLYSHGHSVRPPFVRITIMHRAQGPSTRTNFRTTTASGWVIPMKSRRWNTVSQKWQSSWIRWMSCSLKDVLVITYNKPLRTGRITWNIAVFNPEDGLPAFLRHRVTPIIVVWFAGRMWKNNSRCYT
jgi:hypothetical protein